MAAERKKRAAILESEGARAAQVNAAEGKREATVLGARGEQERLRTEAAGLAESVERVASALLAGGAGGGGGGGGGGGDEPSAAEVARARRDAARLLVERQHITALQGLASSANAKVMLFPSGARELASAAVLGDAAAGSPAPEEQAVGGLTPKLGARVRFQCAPLHGGRFGTEPTIATCRRLLRHQLRSAYQRSPRRSSSSQT